MTSVYGIVYDTVMNTHTFRDNELSIICGIEGSLPATISDDGEFVTFPVVKSENRHGQPVLMELCMTWEPESARWESFYSIAG